jgi:hypothetical protein
MMNGRPWSISETASCQVSGRLMMDEVMPPA